MAHEQGFPNTSARKSNVQCLGGQSTLGDTIEEFQIKRNLLLYRMVVLKSGICIQQIIMANAIIKANSQGVCENRWNCIWTSCFILSINDLNSFNNRIIPPYPYKISLWFPLTTQSSHPCRFPVL